MLINQSRSAKLYVQAMVKVARVLNMVSITGGVQGHIQLATVNCKAAPIWIHGSNWNLDFYAREEAFTSCSTGRRRMLQSSDDAPPITDESFSGLISKCLAVAPTDGRCGEENEHGDMSMWNVSLVKDMTAAFKDKSNFNADLTLWNVFQVTSMEEMFSGASAFNSDIIGWDTSEVVNMDSMFMDATEFNADITAWNTSSLTSSAGMFSGATAFADACVKITTGSSSSDGPPSAWDCYVALPLDDDVIDERRDSVPPSVTNIR